MHFTLLAVIALGFVGVFLMLPRQRATWVKLGGLVGVLSLAGLFLFLIREAGSAPGQPPMLFYLFAGIMIAGAAGVICHPKPVYAALYFVLVTLAGAGIFVLLTAEFMAVVLIIVYAGAILVTYVFVLMLASQGAETAEYDRFASEPLVAVLVSFVLLGGILQVIYPGGEGGSAQVQARQGDRMTLLSLGLPVSEPATATQVATSSAPASAPAPAPAGTQLATAATQPYVPSNMQALGSTLYGKYAFSLELAGILLTIALVGAVVFSRKNVEGTSEAGSGRVPLE